MDNGESNRPTLDQQTGTLRPLKPESVIEKDWRQDVKDMAGTYCNVAKDMVEFRKVIPDEIPPELQTFTDGLRTSVYDGYLDFLDSYREVKTIIANHIVGMKQGQAKRLLKEEMDNIGHDFIVVSQYIPYALDPELGELSNEYVHFLSPAILDYGNHILDRMQEKVSGVSEKSSVEPLVVCRTIADFFNAYLHGEGVVEIRAAEQLPQIAVNVLDLEAAVFNPVRNSQKRISHGDGKKIQIILSLEINEGENELVIAIKDDTGGFPPDLLDPVEVRNYKGKMVKTQKAFTRGAAKGAVKGTGFGLDITRRIIEDDLKGKATIRNEAFPGIEKMGAVVEMRIPITKK